MPITEWAEFHRLPGISEATLLAAAQDMQTRLLDRQPGYVSRQLLARGDSHYADVVCWRDAGAAATAIAVAAQYPECRAYFALLQMARPVALGRRLLHCQAAAPAIGGMEFSLFRLMPGASEAALRPAAQQMARGPYAQEPGFIEHLSLAMAPASMPTWGWPEMQIPRAASAANGAADRSIRPASRIWR